MKKLKMLVLSLVAIAGITTVVMYSGSADAAKACTTEIVSGGYNGIQVNSAGTSASATVVVRGGKKCKRPVTLAVWKLPNAQGHPLTAQKFYGSKTKMYGPGRHTITAKLPPCYWQVDLLWQKRPKSIHGDARYDWSNNPNVPRDILAGFRLGGNKPCKTTKPGKAPTCTITASKTEVEPGTEVTIKWKSKNSTGGNIEGIGQVNKTGKKKVTIDSTTTFSGTFKGKDGKKDAVCDATVTVSETPTEPEEPTEPETPITPEEPETPTTPTEPETPTTPEEPTTPDEPTTVVETASVKSEVTSKLPDTGPGAVVALTGFSAVVSGVAHFFIKKRFLF